MQEQRVTEATDVSEEQDVQLLDKPTANDTVATIKAWLDQENIDYPSSANKADLVALLGE